MVRGQRETWRILRESICPEDRPVWFHAASLGEFEQGRPLMERLRREHPEEKILLTFFSPSGYEVRKNYDGADVICYLPFDTAWSVRRFLRLAHPSRAIFIKYEFWANYLRQLHRREIPVYSVSSIFRPGQVFFRWWNCGYRAVLRHVTHFFVQNEASRELLAGIGLTNVTVVGDTRFDRVVDIRNQAADLPEVERFLHAGAGQKPLRTFVVGSSWEADEDVYLDYFSGKDWKLIIAPHVVSAERIGKLQTRLEALGIQAERLSEYTESSGDAAPSALLVDGYGKLSSIYRYATVAYVGGGFGVGIHNVPEAAVYGVPVIIGPNNRKFREAQALLENGGCREVTDAESFAATMDDLTNHPAALAAAGEAAGRYIRSNAGAADAIFSEIFQRK
ncbi:MAG: 3-deoxy-D-manno-octulosonic acid transferase [Alloprevotella sp.]|nr:3-deoxy-D-manno-octulosonic acid transferase [Alloprevotella sp.]